MKKSFRLYLSLLCGLLFFAGFSMKAEAAGDTLFYIEKNAAAGLDGRVTVSVEKKNGEYSGTVWLPGSAEIDQLKLCWEDASLKLTLSGKSCVNGKTSLPGKDESAVYTLSGSRTGKCTLTVRQGSAAVPGLFLEIDETYRDKDGVHTLALMNEDPQHEKTCFGTVTMEGQTFDMKIKGRGNTTWSKFDKKPYNITLYKPQEEAKDGKQYSDKKKAELIEGVKAKQWTILTDEDDPTCLRNKIGYDLAKKMGIGLDSENVDVWMNGEYRGNYLLTPKNDYKAPENGFMIEVDNKNDENQFRFNAPTSPRFTIKDQGNGFENPDRIKDIVRIGWSFLIKQNSEKYQEYIDLDSWAKMYLLNELYKDVDISAGSIFFTKASAAAEDKWIAGPVWDLDGTMGRVSLTYVKVDHTYEQTGEGWFIDSIQSGDIPLFQYLGMHESFMQRVYEIYNEYLYLFEGEEGILAELEKQSELIADSARMNFLRWPDDMVDTEHYTIPAGGKTYGSGTYAVVYTETDSWEAFTENLAEYLRKRLLFFSDQLGVEMPEGSVSGSGAVRAGEQLTLKAEGKADSYRWQSSADGKNWTDIEGAGSAVYSVTADASMNGLQLRCVLRNEGSAEIETSRVCRTKPGAAFATAPVGLQVSSDESGESSAEEDPSAGETDETLPGEKDPSESENAGTSSGGEGLTKILFPVLGAAVLAAAAVVIAVLRKKRKQA